MARYAASLCAKVEVSRMKLVLTLARAPKSIIMPSAKPMTLNINRWIAVCISS